MSALELLEKLGSDASLRNNSQLASEVINQIDNEKSKLWCILMPADDEEKNDDDSEETENSVSCH